MSLVAASALISILLSPVPVPGQPAFDQLRIVAPAAPGGGWDQTARVMQDVLQRTGRVRTVTVENIPGAAGTIGLARFIGGERGTGGALMISGLIMLGAIVTHRSPVTLDDVTPIARLTGEYEVIAVPANSRFRSLRDLIDALKARPEAISWGGGSAGGGDHIFAGLVAAAAGVSASRVNYVAFAGGGEALAALVGGQVSVGVSGLAEFAPHFDAGTIRPLAISSGGRLAGLNLPTLREQGIDVEFENWRSVVAPPAIGDDERRRLESLVADMVRSAEWRRALTRYRWIDRYLSGPAFAEFVAAEEARVRSILRDLGGARSDTASRTPFGLYTLFVLGGLVLTAAAMVVQALRSSERRGEPAPVGGTARGEPAPARPPRRAILLLGAGIALNLLLAERAGFIVASAVLFWCTARAFDPRHPGRDGVFSLAVAAGVYVLFTRVLQLPLATGPFGRFF